MVVDLSKFAEMESETLTADSTEMGDAYAMDEVRTREGKIMFQATPIGYGGLNTLDEFAHERTLALGLYETMFRRGQMKRLAALLHSGNRRLLDLQKTLKQMAAMCPNAFWHERAGGAPVVEAAGPYPPLEPAPRGPADQVAVSPHATLDAAPVIDGVFVQVRQVVRHPNIAGGVA